MSSRRRSLAIGGAVVVAALVVWWVLRDHAHAGSSDAPAGIGAPGPTSDHRRDARKSGSFDPHARRVAGVVLSGGAPVGGATVRLVNRATRAGLVAEPRVVADEAGRFDFGPQPSATYLVVAEQAHLTAGALGIDLADPLADPAPDQLRVVLHACAASVHGTVRDAAGGPIAGARVMAEVLGVRTEADVHGSYDLCIPVGSTEISVGADGYADGIARLEAYGPVHRDFELAPEAGIVGRVVRADDRSPVDGAIVEARADRDWQPDRPFAFVGSSHEGGRFRISGAGPGHYVVVATADGLAAPPVEVIAEVGEPEEPIVCALVPTHAIRGKVVERGTTTPVVGVRVTLVARDDDSRGAFHAALTRKDGSFTIEQLPRGDYYPSVRPFSEGDERREPITVVDNDVANVVLEVDKAASISGRVLRGGRPVDDASVSTKDGNAMTDPAGRYTLRGLAAGPHRLYAGSKTQGAFTHRSLDVAAAEQKTGIDLELDLAGSIAGTVVDQTGAGVGDVVVRVSLLHNSDFGTATTADDGTFTVTALSGGGDYLVEVGANGASASPYKPLTGKRLPPISVHDGQTHVTGVRIPIRVERLVLAGHLLTSTGAPVPDATVRITSESRPWEATPSATTDASGRFTIRDLPAGTYSLETATPHGDAELAKVAAGRIDLVMRLRETGTIEGTLDGFAATPEVTVISSDRRGTPYRATVTGTAFRVHSVAPGGYQVTARSATGLAAATVTVTAGAIATVPLANRGVGRITGTVLDDATHQPLAGAWCVARGAVTDYASSDSDGLFAIDGIAPGVTRVTCSGGAPATVTVSAGETSRVDLVGHARPRPREVHLGLELEDQFGEVMVKSVEPGGLAARAGLAAGDVLQKLDDQALVGGSAYVLETLETVAGRAAVRIAIERGDGQLVVTLPPP